MICQVPTCNKRLKRDEVLYNDGYCDVCIEEFLERAAVERKRLKVAERINKPVVG